jgi:hypothetical protein
LARVCQHFFRIFLWFLYIYFTMRRSRFCVRQRYVNGIIICISTSPITPGTPSNKQHPPTNQPKPRDTPVSAEVTLTSMAAQRPWHPEAHSARKGRLHRTDVVIIATTAKTITAIKTAESQNAVIPYSPHK